MAHEIWTLDRPMMGSNKPGWHKKGIVVAGQPNIEEAIKHAKMDWKVICEQALLSDGDGGMLPIPNSFATVRDDLPKNDPRRILGSSVSGRYEPIQNRDVFEIAEFMQNSGAAEIETAGTLKNGRLAWVMSVAPKPIKIKDDELAKYLLLSTSHDGSKALQIMFTPIRVVCWNTLQWALAGSTDKITITHTGDRKRKIENAKVVLGLADKHFGAHEEVMNKMANAAIDDRFAAAFLSAVFPNPETDQKWTTQTKKRNRIFQLFKGEQSGGDQVAVKGTAYGLANAVTEYLDHESTCLAVNRGQDDARMDSIMFGHVAKTRNTALNALTRALEIVKSPSVRSTQVDDILLAIETGTSGTSAVDELLDGIDLPDDSN